MKTLQTESEHKMLAFHGDEAIKVKYLDRVKAHQAADEIIHGTYWEAGKGCAVGCTIHGSDHTRYELELGIPVMLASLEDRIFEGMTNGKAQAWPEQFLAVIKPGSDLGLVGWKFLHWLIGDEKEGMIRLATDKTRPAMNRVIELLAAKADGNAADASTGEIAQEMRRERRASADSAEAFAAAYADDAAASYADDAAASARVKKYERMGEKLLELMAEA